MRNGDMPVYPIQDSAETGGTWPLEALHHSDCNGLTKRESHKELILKIADSGELPSFEEVYKHYEYTMIDCVNSESKSKAAMLGVSLRVLDIFDKYKAFAHPSAKPEQKEWDGEWISVSDCLPTESDSDDFEMVWVLIDGEVYPRRWTLVEIAKNNTHWMRTGIKKPAPLVRTQAERDREELAESLQNDLDALDIEHSEKIAICLAVGMINRGWRKGD